MSLRIGLGISVEGQVCNLPRQQKFPDGLPPRGVWGSELGEEGFTQTMGLVRLALRQPMKNGQGRAILSVPFERSDFHEQAHFSIIE